MALEIRLTDRLFFSKLCLPLVRAWLQLLCLRASTEREEVGSIRTSYVLSCLVSFNRKSRAASTSRDRFFGLRFETEVVCDFFNSWVNVVHSEKLLSFRVPLSEAGGSVVRLVPLTLGFVRGRRRPFP